ncbi:hypothetical protein [Brevibacterium sp.]|uniref:hypothetical protein n=1 Tax=Brevibacterium sp. TaxID=1701 RepID=UPI0025BCFBA4|nr:hypothetical protein [Brevibacterium sp.]
MAKHLAAASALLTEDPELAHAHAQAAVQRGSRVGAVREAAGIIAYQLDLYAEAARELRTHRRITGSNDNLPLIADSERGRGRPEKALELFAEAKEEELGSDLYTELLMVAAGAHIDKGEVERARRLLETRPFNGNANGTLVRLLSVYSDVIRLQGDADLADRYEELARRTAKATGTLFGDEEIDPNEGVEIITLEEVELPEEVADEPDSAADADADADAGTEQDAERGTEASGAEAEASAEAEGLAVSEASAEAGGTGEFAAVDAGFDAEIVDELDEILAAAETDADADDTDAEHPEEGAAETDPRE